MPLLALPPCAIENFTRSFAMATGACTAVPPAANNDATPSVEWVAAHGRGVDVRFLPDRLSGRLRRDGKVNTINEVAFHVVNRVDLACHARLIADHSAIGGRGQRNLVTTHLCLLLLRRNPVLRPVSAAGVTLRRKECKGRPHQGPPKMSRQA